MQSMRIMPKASPVQQRPPRRCGGDVICASLITSISPSAGIARVVRASRQTFCFISLNGVDISSQPCSPSLTTPAHHKLIKANMKSLHIIGIASAATITTMIPQPIIDTHIPVTTAPSLESRIPRPMSQDSWQCHTEIMEQYFEFPTASGELGHAFTSFRVRQTSKYCAFPEKDWDLCDPIPDSAWCAFSTIGPKTLQPAFSAHVNSVYSWSSEHSASLAALPTKCPDTWDRARNDVIIDGQAWLNETLSQASCHENAKEDDSHNGDNKNNNGNDHDTQDRDAKDQDSKNPPKESSGRTDTKQSSAGSLCASQLVKICVGLGWLVWTWS